jgi:hypothetical protein
MSEAEAVIFVVVVSGAVQAIGLYALCRSVGGKKFSVFSSQFSEGAAAPGLKTETLKTENCPEISEAARGTRGQPPPRPAWRRPPIQNPQSKIQNSSEEGVAI